LQYQLPVHLFFDNQSERDEMNGEKIDPVCLLHGKKLSEHICLYCCLCFKDLTSEECHVTEDGKKEDVCNDCAKLEREMMEKYGHE
jgi:hypothetical protein